MWQPRKKFVVTKSRRHKSNVTVIGALSHGRLFCKVESTTNADTVSNFIKSLAEAHDLRGTVLVADNHRAHISW